MSSALDENAVTCCLKKVVQTKLHTLRYLPLDKSIEHAKIGQLVIQINQMQRKLLLRKLNLGVTRSRLFQCR